MGISRTRRGAGNLNFIPKLHLQERKQKSMNTKSNHFDVIVIGSGFAGWGFLLVRRVTRIHATQCHVIATDIQSALSKSLNWSY
jgi:hypothetical protein